jgi:ion channel-forming bestrophin family protein
LLIGLPTNTREDEALMDDTTIRRSDEAFWTEVFTFRGSVTPYVIRRILVFGGIALIVYLLSQLIGSSLATDLGPFEVAGAVLGLLLVFRTNSGYDRWYEGRRLLGGIVNDSRNLAITALTHGPDDPAWQAMAVRWIASFAHACRASLRGEGLPVEVRSLLGPQAAAEVARADNMPVFIALRIGQIMRQAVDERGMDRYGFLESELERARLIDDYGGCYRILKTPIPWVYSVKTRQFVFLYLTAVPFALLDRAGWLLPLVTMLIAYPVLSLDQLGIELQNPFATKSLNHLPLDEITAGIETNLLALLPAGQGARGVDADRATIGAI